jgi:Zn finger protein HypA/HybF involved in hydrogenase expression
MVPLEATCSACGASTEVDDVVPACPACGAFDPDLRGGDELVLESIEYRA